jgi:hypothetical protein
MLLTTFRVPALIIVTAASFVLSLPLDSIAGQSALVARTNGSEGFLRRRGGRSRNRPLVDSPTPVTPGYAGVSIYP